MFCVRVECDNIEFSMFNFFKKKEKSLPDMWRMFTGKGASEEVLIEKAKLFAAVLLDWLKESVNDLVGRASKDNQKAEGVYGQVFFELVLFSLHYTDRIASEFLSENGRKTFMDALATETQEMLLQAQPDEEARKMTSLLFITRYDERQKEYSNYKFSGEKEGGLNGTLFWEFEKKVSTLLGFEEDIVTMMDIHGHICVLLKYLQIPELITKI